MPADQNFPVLNFQDFIAADGDKLTTDTLKVAAVHGKRHDDVLKLVRKRMSEAGEWGLRNFAESSYINEQGKSQPMFQMTKLGYAFVAGKMTGKKAVVEGMGLDWKSQHSKLKAHGGRWGMVEIAIPSVGGAQGMSCLPLRKLPATAAGLAGCRCRESSARRRGGTGIAQAHRRHGSSR